MWEASDRLQVERAVAAALVGTGVAAARTVECRRRFAPQSGKTTVKHGCTYETARNPKRNVVGLEFTQCCRGPDQAATLGLRRFQGRRRFGSCRAGPADGDSPELGGPSPGVRHPIQEFQGILNRKDLRQVQHWVNSSRR